MSISELINEIVRDWAYRVDDGMPNSKNPMHVKELENVLFEMGLGHVKSEILQSLNEAEEGGFTNPALNKKVRYKNAKGEDKEGIVGNLLRQPEDSPGRKAAEAALPPDGSPERDAMNKELGSEKDGKAKPPEDAKGKEGEDGKEGGAAAEDEKKKKAAAMFDPKTDPAMGARMDREKAANDKLAQKDKEDSEAEKAPTPGSPEDWKNKADKVAKDKEEAKKKGYDDSLHAMSDTQLDTAITDAEKKMHDAQKSGDDKTADKANTEYAQHKVEKAMRNASKSGDREIADAAAGNFLARKKEYEEKYGEPYKADIPYPDSDGGERTSAKWGGEEPTGPEAGPNAEPPANEPSKPDTTPPTDADKPKDGEEPPAPAALGDKPEEETKIDKTAAAADKLLDKAEKDVKDIELLKQLRDEEPELFDNMGIDWDKTDTEVLAQIKDRNDTKEKLKQNAAKEKTKKKTKKAASELGKRKTADGEDLDVETTDNGSMIIGVEHGAGTESTKKTIESIQKLPKDTKVMFVGEGGMTKDNDGNLKLSGEQDEIRNAVKGHFDNAEEGSWDENADVFNENSPVFDEVGKTVGGSKSKSKAAIWSNMYGQDGKDSGMNADDYLDDEGKAWLVDQAQKGGVTSINKDTDFNNLSDEQKDDLYQLNYRDDDGYGETEISKAQQEYNGFRQKELDRKVKEAEDNGFTVIAPVGNSHVDMWRQRNKSKQKPEETPTDTKPEDKPEETPKEEPKAAETPKATKDDIKKEKPGKEAKTDSGGSLYSVGGGYYSDKPNGPAKYVRTESVIEMAFDNSLNEDVFALFEKSITGTLQNGEKITVQELPPRAVKKATQRAKAAAATSKEEPAQQPTSSTEKPAEQPAAKKTDGTDVPGKFTPIETPPPKNEKGVEKDGKIAGTTIETEPALQNIDPEFLKQKSTEMNKYYDHFKEDKKKAEGIAREKMGYDEEQAKGLNGDEKAAYEAEVKKNQEPTYNLCKVSLPNSNLFCSGNKGIPRKDMPQFKGEPVEGSQAWDVLQKAKETDPTATEADGEPYFRQMLADKGVKVTDAEVPSESLKATQTELVGDKVLGMKSVLDAGPSHPAYKKMTAPLYVSKDGYVVDGHHRWAAITAYNMEHPDKPLPLKAMIIDQDIDQAIETSNDFANEFGVAAKSGKQTGADTQKSEPQQPTSAPNGKTSNVAKKAIDRIKDGVKQFKEDETEFFKKKVHKGNSPERRTFGEAFKHKAKGAWEAIKYGAEHEVHLFKSAGSGVKNFFSGGKVSDEEKKALIGVAKKVAIAAAFGAVGGGLVHGALAFGKHVMIEFIPHVVAETVAMGAGKAALFAGAEDDDTDMMKFMEIISKKLQSADIPNEVMASAVESYNENKPKKEMTKENLQLADKLMLEMIYGFIAEAKPNAKAQRILNQRIKYKEDGVDHDIKVSTALKYKNSEKGGQKKAYRDALQLFKKAGVAIPDSGTTKKPVGKTIAPSGFRQTPDMEKKPTKTAPKAEPTPRSETNNPHKKNGNEGETILELKPEEIDSILEKYVNAGEKTPDEMRELTPDYSKQDMAEGYSDEEFYSDEHKKDLVKQKIKVRSKPYKMDEASRKNLKDAGFPEKYIKFLERCINTQVNGKKPKVTELIKQGGAGQIQSQFGEVMAMAFMSIRDPKLRRQMADVLNSEITKSSEEFGGGKASPVATKDWVEASLTHAEAFDSAMDEKYGKGQWRFEGASWDIRDDVESLGLDYKNKGFSTDVMLRVQPLKNGKPNGPARAQKNSLKKDENIFFFNGSINEVNNFVLNYLDEKERKRVKGYEAIATKASASNKNAEEKAAALAAAERITGLKGAKAVAALKQKSADIRNKAFEAAPQHVKDAVSKVRNFGAAQTASAERLIKTANTDIKNPNNVIDNAKNIDGGDKDFAKFSYKAVKECKASGTKDMTTCIRQKLSKAGEDTTDDRVCKVAVLASKVAIAAGDTNAEKALNKHYNLAVEAGNALMEVLPESEELMGGLMQKLADAFPMKTCMDGEEFMCIDGMKVTQKTLQTVFGVTSYDELQKGMKLKRLPNGETILVYGAKSKDGKDIPIGVVGARQKGKGYEGTVGFEISCSDDFALAIAEANSKNGDTSTSNEKARQSIGKRVNGREAKAGKKK